MFPRRRLVQGCDPQSRKSLNLIWTLTRLDLLCSQNKQKTPKTPQQTKTKQTNKQGWLPEPQPEPRKTIWFIGSISPSRHFPPFVLALEWINCHPGLRLLLDKFLGPGFTVECRLIEDLRCHANKEFCTCSQSIHCSEYSLLAFRLAMEEWMATVPLGSNVGFASGVFDELYWYIYPNLP